MVVSGRVSSAGPVADVNCFFKHVFLLGGFTERRDNVDVNFDQLVKVVLASVSFCS